MKKTVIVGSIFPEYVGTDVYSQLVSIFPEGQDKRSFRAVLDEGDPRLMLLIGVLESRGFHADRTGARREVEFPMRIERSYDKSDFQSVRYLQVLAKVCMDLDCDRGDTGRGPLRLHAKRIKPKVEIGCGLVKSYIIVADSIRKLFEDSDLLHVSFRDVDIVGRGAEQYQSAYWQLWGDYVLPRVSATCTLTNHLGEPFDYDRDLFCHLKEGLYHTAEVHFAESALTATPPFDLALTYETFGGVDDHQLIASKRFYQFCIAHKLKLDWVPVRIDPD
ncbi:MAG: hypothetical protein HY318_00295 [Armatimonadetes bacterium]|nr:hypothetical protein [Armatimonadota bacterium]